MPPSTVTRDAFTRAVAALRSASPRSEISISELSAPRRLAPYAYALGATVQASGGGATGVPDATDVAPEPAETTTGRLVLLHDPAGQRGWQGTTRLVSYVTTELETDLAADMLMPEVGWSWLVEALESHRAEYAALAGTVTRTTSTGFGDLSGPSAATDLEIRASWSPMPECDLRAHVDAWCMLLASAAGLPPPGVRKLRSR